MEKSANQSRKQIVVVLNEDLMLSKAWLSLSATSMRVFLAMRMRCQMKRAKIQARESSPIPGWDIVNNGKLVATYKQLQEQLDIGSPTTVCSAIDMLIDRGFIRISEPGGPDRTPTKHAISGDWRLYGNDSFKPDPRPRRPGFGFQKGRG